MIEILKLIFCLPFLLLACQMDLKTRRISNKIWITMILFGSPFILYDLLTNNLSYLILATIAVVVSYIIVWILFQFNVFGGADAKILIVLSILFSSQYFIALSTIDNAVLLTSVVFLGSLLFNLLKGNLIITKYKVPFLIPITIGFYITFFAGDILLQLTNYILVHHV